MNRDSDEDQSDDDYLPGPSSEFYQDEEIEVDTLIGGLLSGLRLEDTRLREPSLDDDEMLRNMHERLQATIHREPNDARRRRLKKALPNSNCLREQIFYLRRCMAHSSVTVAPSYFPKLQAALGAIVAGSFNEEYRKDAILLGMVDALAEILILEVAVFGGLPVQSAGEHRSVRKLIANALTNLTFGHIKSKKRLCNYSQFMPTVVRIIQEAANLAQVYAGLIRNLSWLADAEMSTVLAQTVPVLVKSAIESKQRNEEGTLKASLAALWNLASHSMNNKQAICDYPGSLFMLAELLTPNEKQTLVVESASGILKYATQYLSCNSSHLPERQELTAGLVQLLTSGSFTILCNALNALANLIGKDPHLQASISQNGQVMDNLKILHSSAREDIRSAVKTVLNHLNSSFVFNQRMYNEMSSSVGIGFDASRDAGRLLPHRHMRTSPGAPVMMANSHLMTSPSHGARCSSLPRHFVRPEGPGFISPQIYPGGPGMLPQNCFAPPPMMAPPTVNTVMEPRDENMGFQNDFDPVEDDSMSAKCNRSNASRNSLESDILNFSGFASHVDTVNNSRLSPVSPSDLPSSPTHYTYEKMKQEAAENALKANLDPLAPLNLKCSDISDVNSDSERLTSSDAATAIADDFATPTYPKPHEQRDVSQSPELPGPSEENDYATVETANDLLQKSIEAALPKVSTGRYRSEGSAKADFLADMIEKSMPVRSPAKTPRKNANTQGDSDRLLKQSIMSAMPSPRSSGTSQTKNEQGGRDQQVTETDRPLQGHRNKNNAPQHHSIDSSDDDSDGSFGMEASFDEIDTSIPLDCLMEEMTIDCSVASSSRSATFSARQSKLRIPTISQQRSSLPRPTGRIRTPMAVTPVKPRAKPVQAQAVVQPYNYQKPKEKPKENEYSEKFEKKKSQNGVILSNTLFESNV